MTLPGPSARPSTALTPPSSPRSAFSSMLPHLPRIPSLRRTLSLHHLPQSPYGKTLSISAPTTPPSEPNMPASGPASSSTRESTPTQPRTLALDDYSHQRNQDSFSSLSSTTTDIPYTVIETCQQPPYPQQSTITTNIQTESATGITWTYLPPALQLLHLAAPSSNSLKLPPEELRGLYTDALKYLIRGLPPTLSSSEIETLRSTLPPTLLFPNPLPPPASARIRRQTHLSLLHRFVARVVTLVIVVIQMLFTVLRPYVRLGVERAWRYENENKVLERVVTEGMSAGREMMSWVWGAGGGDVVKWFVEGVLDGLSEGGGGWMRDIGGERSGGLWMGI